MAVGCAVSAVLGTLIVSMVNLTAVKPSHCVGSRALGYCTYTINPLWYAVGAVGAVAVFFVMVRAVFHTARLFRGRITEGHGPPAAP